MTSLALTGYSGEPRLRWLPALAISVAVHAAVLVMIRLPPPLATSAGGGNRLRLTLVSGAAPAAEQPRTPVPEHPHPTPTRKPARKAPVAAANHRDRVVQTRNPDAPRSTPPAQSEPAPRHAQSSHSRPPHPARQHIANTRPERHPSARHTKRAAAQHARQESRSRHHAAHRVAATTHPAAGRTAANAAGPGAASHATGPASDPRYQGAGLHNPPPVYPFLARRQGQQGEVTLSVTVGPGGRPLVVTVMHSSGYPLLDRAARRAVEQWHFQPALADGRPVAGRVLVPVRFRLTSG